MNGAIYYEDGYMNFPNDFGTHDSYSYQGSSVISRVYKDYGLYSPEYAALANFVNCYHLLSNNYESSVPKIYWDPDLKKWELCDKNTDLEFFIRFCRLQQD